MKRPHKRTIRRPDRVETTFLESIHRRCPGNERVLAALGDLYTRTGRFADGLAMDLALVQHSPKDAVVWYNLACSYSLTDQTEQSFQALEKAIALGYDDVGSLNADPDLVKVRTHPKFQQLLARIKPVECPF